MSEEEKEHVVTRIAEVCDEIKVFQSNARTGSAYSWMNPLQEARDGRVEVQHYCQELGMDCSVFVLSHNDLGPTNIIVNRGRIAVIDWEMARYIPLEWARTKFAARGVLKAERVTRPSEVCDGKPRYGLSTTTSTGCGLSRGLERWDSQKLCLETCLDGNSSPFVFSVGFDRCE
jgi:hypothetical protein